MNLIEYADTEMLAINLANRLAGDLRTALSNQDRVLLVVPGGTTPGPVFDGLCAADLDWARVDVLLSDERWHPSDHPRSNTRLVREHLLVERAAAARMLPMYADVEAPEDAISELTANISDKLPISVLLLGMGVDMHTASLFPGADNLAAAMDGDAPVLMAMNVPGEPEARITLTAPVLDGAMCKHIVITGDAKRTALEKARGLSPLDAPVAGVMDNSEIHWAL